MRIIRQHTMAGFTLIEMVTVIVIMGILAVGVSSFLQFGSRIYAESHTRDQLVASARFVVERLNREVRHALPNSLELVDVPISKRFCLYFTPVIKAATYDDIPVAPEVASKTIKLIPFDDDDNLYAEATRAIVYPLTPNDAKDGSGKVYSLSTNGINKVPVPWVITLDTPAGIHFSADSPTKRIYFVDGRTEYCLQNQTLQRDGVTIATNIINETTPFNVLPATLQRNAMVQISLQFKQNDEVVFFNTEVQVPNVP